MIKELPLLVEIDSLGRVFATGSNGAANAYLDIATIKYSQSWF
jgi:hypothetical protein